MVYEQIRDFIKASGLKYNFVAERSGIKTMAFTSIMNGERKISAEEYFAICDALGVDANTFRPKEAG